MAGRENIPDSQPEDHRTAIKNCVDSYDRNVKMMEYARLRSLVPSVAYKARVSKIQVIEEAIKYIAQLQQALRTQPDSTVQGEVTEENIAVSWPEKRRKTLRKKRQRITSFMIKANRHMPRTRPKSTKSTAKKRTEFLRI